MGALLSLLLLSGLAVAGPEGMDRVHAVRSDDRFALPSHEETVALAELCADLMRLAPQGVLPRDATKRAEAAGYALERDGDRVWLTDARGRGGGVFGIRLGPLDREVILQAPHPFFDLRTGTIVSRMYAELPIRAVQLASAQRYVADESDAAHAPLHPFNTATDGLVRGSPSAFVVQLHGFAVQPNRSADLYVSGGRSWWSRDDFEGLTPIFQTHFPSWTVEPGGPSNGLGGRTNVQAAMLAGRAPVLLLELAPELRKGLREEAAQRAALWQVLEATESILRVPAVPTPGWSDALTLSEAVGPEGRVELPAATALRLNVEPRDVLPTIVDEAGQAVELVGLEDSLLVPAEPWSRSLHVATASTAAVTLWFQSRRGQSAEWDDWERRAFRAVRREQPLPAAIPGAQTILRELEARREVGLPPRLVALGLLHDITLSRPLSAASFGPPEPVGVFEHGVLTATVEGPARLQLMADWQEVGPLDGARLMWTVDGAATHSERVRPTPGPRRLRSMFVPPGVHEVSIRLEGAPASLSAERRALRPSAAWPSFRLVPTSPLEEAELLFLTGGLEQAHAHFLQLAEAGGSVGAFARARLLEGGYALHQPADLTQLPEGAGPASSALFSAALLTRGSEVTRGQAEQALQRLAHPVPEDLAIWLDANSVDRPHGTGLWSAQFAAAPVLATDGGDLTRHLRDHTTLRSLVPDGVVLRTWRATPPGIARALLDTGAQQALQLPPRPLEQETVLRLQCPVDCRFSLTDADGVPQVYAGPPGRYDVAPGTGDVTLTVSEGQVLVLDPELVPNPVFRYESTGGTLPARWTLPGADVPVDLRPEVQPGGTLTEAIFDDGTVRQITPRGLVAPAGARSVWIRGTGVGSLAMRTHRLQDDRVDFAPVQCDDANLSSLESTSRRVVEGHEQERLELVRLLGCIGLTGMARTQLEAAHAHPQTVPSAARRLERWLLTTLPDAPTAGPVQLLSTTASVGAAGTTDGAELAALARAHPARAGALWREAALAWEAKAQRPETSPEEADQLRASAMDAAMRAGSAGAVVRARLLAQLDWDDVSIPESGAGVDMATLSKPADPGNTLAARARRALWAWPWPSESALRLRNTAAATVVLPTHREAHLEVACRDDLGTRAACELELRVNNARIPHAVPVGAPLSIPVSDTTSGAPAAQSVELHGPGEGRTLSVRLVLDGAVVPPTTTRQVLRTSPEQPISFVATAPSVLRVQSIDGEELTLRVRPVETGPERVEEPLPERVTVLPKTEPVAGAPPDLILHDRDAGPLRVEIMGTGRVLVRLGIWKAVPDPEVMADQVDEEGFSARDVSPTERLLGELGGVARVPREWGALPGPGSTWEFAATAGRDQVWSPSEPWPVAELSADWLHRTDVRWVQAGGWVHGPNEAAGTLVELGRRSDHGWLGGRASGRAGRDIAGQVSSSAGLLVFGVRDVPLAPTTDLRFEGRADGVLQSDGPMVVADPAVWTTYRDQHPVYVEGGARLLHSWNRESRVDVAVGARSNTGLSLDRYRTQLGWDRLFGSATWLTAEVGADLRLADQHRSTTNWNPTLNARLQHVITATEDTHLRVWTSASLQPITGGFEAWLGIRYLRSNGRGLRDLAPYRELFRTELEGR